MQFAIDDGWFALGGAPCGRHRLKRGAPRDPVRDIGPYDVRKGPPARVKRRVTRWVRRDLKRDPGACKRVPLGAVGHVLQDLLALALEPCRILHAGAQQDLEAPLLIGQLPPGDHVVDLLDVRPHLVGLLAEHAPDPLPGDRLHLARQHSAHCRRLLVGLLVDRVGTVETGGCGLRPREHVLDGLILGRHRGQVLHGRRMGVDRGEARVVRIQDVVVEIPDLVVVAQLLRDVLPRAVHEDRGGSADRLEGLPRIARFLALLGLDGVVEVALRRDHRIRTGVMRLVIGPQPDPDCRLVASGKHLAQRFAVRHVESGADLSLVFRLQRVGQQVTECRGVHVLVPDVIHLGVHDVPQALGHRGVHEPVFLRREGRDHARHLFGGLAPALTQALRDVPAALIPEFGALPDLGVHRIVDGEDVVAHLVQDPLQLRLDATDPPRPFHARFLSHRIDDLLEVLGIRARGRETGGEDVVEGLFGSLARGDARRQRSGAIRRLARRGIWREDRLEEALLALGVLPLEELDVLAVEHHQIVRGRPMRRQKARALVQILDPRHTVLLKPLAGQPLSAVSLLAVLDLHGPGQPIVEFITLRALVGWRVGAQNRPRVGLSE